MYKDQLLIFLFWLTLKRVFELNFDFWKVIILKYLLFCFILASFNHLNMYLITYFVIYNLLILKHKYLPLQERWMQKKSVPWWELLTCLPPVTRCWSMSGLGSDVCMTCVHMTQVCQVYEGMCAWVHPTLLSFYKSYFYKHEVMLALAVGSCNYHHFLEHFSNLGSLIQNSLI